MGCAHSLSSQVVIHVILVFNFMQMEYEITLQIASYSGICRRPFKKQKITLTSLRMPPSNHCMVLHYCSVTAFFNYTAMVFFGKGEFLNSDIASLGVSNTCRNYCISNTCRNYCTIFSTFVLSLLLAIYKISCKFSLYQVQFFIFYEGA